MPEKIDRSILVPVCLSLAEWETILGPVIYDRDASGKRIRPAKRDFVAFSLLARGARSKIKTQLLEALQGKD